MDNKIDKEIGQQEVEQNLFSKNSERILNAFKTLKSQISKTPYKIKIFSWEIFSGCRFISDEMQLDFFDIIFNFKFEPAVKKHERLRIITQLGIKSENKKIRYELAREILKDQFMSRENLHTVCSTIADTNVTQAFIKELNEFILILLTEERIRKLVLYTVRNYLLNRKYPEISKTLEKALTKAEIGLLED